VSRLIFPICLASAFVVALGYGVILPIAPLLVERIAGASTPSATAWHTGALSAAYMLAIFVGAPLWGALSDRIGRRPVIMAGLSGYVLMLVLFAFSRDVLLTYLTRVLAGAFVSAVLPVTSAYVADTGDEGSRARRYAALSAATLFGFLFGPALSGGIYSLARRMNGSEAMVTNMIMWPLLVTAALGLVILGAMYTVLRQPAMSAPVARSREHAMPSKEVFPLLALNFLVTVGLGTFEVALPLAGRDLLGLDPVRISVLFAECSLMMLAVQCVLFFAHLGLHGWSGYLPAIGFVAMAIGFGLLGAVTDFRWLLMAVGLIAGGSGVLLPILVFITSLRGMERVGAALGLLVGTGSLGQAVGSAAGAWLFGGLSEAAFWLAGVAMMFGAIASRAQVLRQYPAGAANRHGYTDTGRTRGQ
jgi:MFS family permease